MEVHTLVAVVGDGGKLVCCPSVGGLDGAMEGGLISFGVPHVVNAACPSGGNLVVILVVGGKVECDATFSLLDCDVAVGCFMLFDLARQRGYNIIKTRC